jgi:DNA polymerase III delta prime subunit
MTVQAANSVLKLLEEPPAGWVFLLTAADSSLMLPTIVSRCQAIRLKPFSRDTIEELLRLGDNIDERKIPICAELAQGSWGKALSWTQPETWEKRKLIVEFIQDPKSQLNALVDWASTDPRNMDRMMDQLESLASDLIRWSLSGVTPSAQPGSPDNYRWTNSDAKTALVQNARNALKIGHELARAQWISRAERIARARVELQAPINRKLLAADLLMPWLT